MSTFVTDLFWAEEKQPEAPLPAGPHDRQDQKEPKDAVATTPAVAVENNAERLQRVAGNAALAREAEEAEAAKKKLAEAARRPEKVPAKAPMPAAVKARPGKKKEENPATAPADAKASPTARKKTAEKRAVEKAVAVTAERLPEASKAAAARATALAQVLGGFERNPGKANLLALALLVESAPPEIADGTARALAQAVMRADPDQRAAIAARVKSQLGDRPDLRLARLLADRLAWVTISPPRAAPPAPPPPPAPPG